MRIEKSGGWTGGILIALAMSGGAMSLTACNAQPQENETASAGEDHFHEKSFSWDNPAGKVSASGALAKTAAARTRFGSGDELGKAVTDMDEALKTPGYSDSLWKPIDYACDELTLGLWNKYGTISIGDSVVLDEASLKASCRYVGEDAALAKSAGGSSEAIDRQYPYKMIGTSWDQFNIGIYNSTGGETQFKKDRTRFGVKGWYDTDASRIGVRIYLFDCTLTTPYVCVGNGIESSWYSNDDYVSKRDAYYKVYAGTYPNSSNGWNSLPIKGGPVVAYKEADAVTSVHSVDHAGLQFRAISSSGHHPSATYYQEVPLQYVTW